VTDDVVPRKRSIRFYIFDQSVEVSTMWVRIAPEAEQMDHVLASHSLNAEPLEAHVALYRVVMFGPSGLSRGPSGRPSRSPCSAANDCHY
jgi:hypothetical protein